MKVETALARLVENTQASTTDRIRALRLLKRVPLCMLRRLLARSRKTPDSVPLRLVAAATLAYAKEVGIRKGRPKKEKKIVDGEQANPLGI